MRGSIQTGIGRDRERRSGRVGSWVSLLAFVAVLAAMIPVAPAFALTTRLEQGSFGTSAEEEMFNAIAVDQSTGDVYVTEWLKHVVLRFDSNGAPDDFTAGPDAGTNVVTGFQKIEGYRSPYGVAVDNSGGPMKGDFYVIDGAIRGTENTSTIKVFARSGAQLGEITEAGAPPDRKELEEEPNLPSNRLYEPCGIAVDQSDGSVYVSEFSTHAGLGHIWRYAPSSPSGTIDRSDYVLTGVSTTEPCGLAANAGHVYALQEQGNGTVREYRSSEFTAAYPAVTGPALFSNAFGVAVDPVTGDIFADEGFQVAVIDSTGKLLYRFGRPGGIGTQSFGVAVKSAGSGAAPAAYVTDGDERGEAAVHAFGPVTHVQRYTRPEKTSFGQDGSTVSVFNNPRQLALDQSARALYVWSESPAGLFGFDVSSPAPFALLAGFDPLATTEPGNTDLAVDNSGGASAGYIYLAVPTTDLVYGFDASGNPLGGNFPIDPQASPGAPYGSPAEICGVAVDGAGHIWVANGATKRVLEYGADGAWTGVTIDASALGHPCRLAFDAEGNLYVSKDRGRPEGVWRFAVAGGYTTSTRIDIRNPVQVAVDRARGRVLVAHSAGLPTNPRGTTVGWFDEYDEAGDFLEEYLGEIGSLPEGLAVDETSHDAYLADFARQQVRQFGPPVILPEVNAEPASAIGNNAATLNGTVGTQRLALTDCHFEYVTEEAFRLSGFSDLGSGGSVPCAPSAGSIPADFEDHAVSASVSGLTGYTGYRFRLVAANAQGNIVSEPEAFSTTSPPGVEIAGAPDRSTTTAVLNGRVNPRNVATTFHFEYGDEGPCAEDPCLSTPTLSAGSVNEIELVASQIEGLKANTTYHYRLVADNGNPAGAAVSPEMTVTTRSSDSPLSHGHFPGPPGSDRAYEQVSLPDSGGNPVGGGLGFSEDGDRALYSVNGGTPITDNGSLGNFLLSERTPEGWQSRQITPPRPLLSAPAWSLSMSSDLKTILGVNFPFSDKVESMAIWHMPSSGEDRELLRTGPPTLQAAFSGVLGISRDGSREIAYVRGTVDPEYPATGSEGNLYDVGSGSPHLVSVLPGNVPACVIAENKPSQATASWVSADGSLVYFPSQGTGSSCTGPTELYMREVQAGQTRLLSGPVVSGEDCGAALIRATEGAVFFWSQSRLVANDTAPGKCGGTSPSDGDVYRYDIHDQSLKCLTCVVPGLAADVYAGNRESEMPRDIGVASDGSRVYFKTDVHLLAGAQPEGEFGAYRVDVASGTLAYVAPVGDSHVGRTSGGGNALSGDGSVLVFRSDSAKLNPIGGPGGNGGQAQYYRYDDRDRSLVCISCMPDGSSREAVPAALTQGENPDVGVTAASEDGSTIAFVTANPLVPADQNTPATGGSPAAGQDVYEWRDGRLFLITDGLTSWPTNGPSVVETPGLSGVSRSGRDVYFTAPVQYTPDALDGYRRLYDARIGGGIEFPQPPVPCSLEVCQGIPRGAPLEQAPGTVTFAGPGNIKPAQAAHVTLKCLKRQRRVVKGRNARCVAKHAKKKRHKKDKRKRSVKTHKSNRNGRSGR